MKTFNLKQLAATCSHAQDFVENWEPPFRENQLQGASYIVACFFAKELGDGVEWDVIHDDLCLNPKLSVEEWEKILSKKFQELENAFC